MVEVIENELIFKSPINCYNCSTEMYYTGYTYECPVCGSIQR